MAMTMQTEKAMGQRLQILAHGIFNGTNFELF
jgi:hypothetical protein